MFADDVSPDGSPLAVYLALPAGDGPSIVSGALPPGGSILELGSGPGRLTRVLVALGHPVIAVDDSPEMLAHVTAAEAVVADAWTVALDRTVDAVLAASHLINRPGRASRRSLLANARRHLEPGGLLILERHVPGWLITTGDSTSSAGPVTIDLTIGQLVGRVRSATATYRLGDRTWRQEFDAEDVDDRTLGEDADATGFAAPRRLDESNAWMTLRAI